MHLSRDQRLKRFVSLMRFWLFTSLAMILAVSYNLWEYSMGIIAFFVYIIMLVTFLFNEKTSEEGD